MVGRRRGQYSRRPRRQMLWTPAVVARFNLSAGVHGIIDALPISAIPQLRLQGSRLERVIGTWSTKATVSDSPSNAMFCMYLVARDLFAANLSPDAATERFGAFYWASQEIYDGGVAETGQHWLTQAIDVKPKRTFRPGQMLVMQGQNQAGVQAIEMSVACRILISTP